VTRPEGSRYDHYEILEHLADGAQAEVHRAKDLRDGSEVVLKFPHGSTLDNPALAGRWRRETTLTLSLDHPNIQCRRDLGERHAEPYVALEYASGGTLVDWIGADPDHLPIAQVVAWGRQLAVAIEYLHREGVLHRDIKPANILLTDRYEIKLADFGAAKRANAQRPAWATVSPATEGTPDYISPEQTVGGEGDARSDVYEWGIVMYELLVGRVPFTGPSPFKAMSARLNENPVSIRELRPDVSPALEAVVMTAMRRMPEHRYQTVAALLDDLEHLDDLDPAGFDLSAEPAYHGKPSAGDVGAMLRFAAIVAVSFLTLVVAIVGVSILVH
jgi:serine/threonine protein kinase